MNRAEIAKALADIKAAIKKQASFQVPCGSETYVERGEVLKLIDFAFHDMIDQEPFNAHNVVEAKVINVQRAIKQILARSAEVQNPEGHRIVILALARAVMPAVVAMLEINPEPSAREEPI